MKFGIIAEGVSDVAVIENILIGLGLIEKQSDVVPLRPEMNVDSYDLNNKTVDEFSNWTLVKEECINRIKFNRFLGIENILDIERKIIIHLDTAECGEKGYEVERPEKNENYCFNLRNSVIEKINVWLENYFMEDIYFAIAIEETEAWIHALYENKDTSKSATPKEAFSRYLSKNKIRVNTQDAFQRNKILSDNFTKLKKKKINTCLENNLSLKLFVESLPAV